MKNSITNTKIWILSLCSLLLLNSCSKKLTAQDNGNAASVKEMIDAKQFSFIAESVSPLRGGNRTLSTGYDVKLSKESFVSHLPYFGRGTSAVAALEGGIKFTSTQFTYEVSQIKDNRWAIVITPSDVREIRQFNFTVFSNGTASLSITSNSRDPISFNGKIKP